MEYLKFETAFHNARVNLSTKIYQTPFYGVVEEMVHFKCTIPKLLTYASRDFVSLEINNLSAKNHLDANPFNF